MKDKARIGFFDIEVVAVVCYNYICHAHHAMECSDKLLIVLAVFLAVSSWGVWGPDRNRPDGDRLAILDLGLALGTRVAIHGFFITALVLIGAAWELPVLLVVALILLAAEWPLGRLVHARHTAAHAAARQAVPDGAPASAQSWR